MGENKINPKVAMNESWKDGSETKMSGFQRSIKIPATNNVRKASFGRPRYFASIAITAIIEALMTVDPKPTMKAKSTMQTALRKSPKFLFPKYEVMYKMVIAMIVTLYPEMATI